MGWRFSWRLSLESDRDPNQVDALPRWLKIISFALAVIGVAGIIVWRAVFA